MPKYTMQIQTVFTKHIEVDAEDYEQAMDNAWGWLDGEDALHNADLETRISHAYERKHYKED
jgi:hypothetical protein